MNNAIIIIVKMRMKCHIWKLLILNFDPVEKVENGRSGQMWKVNTSIKHAFTATRWTLPLMTSLFRLLFDTDPFIIKV